MIRSGSMTYLQMLLLWHAGPLGTPTARRGRGVSGKTWLEVVWGSCRLKIVDDMWQLMCQAGLDSKEVDMKFVLVQVSRLPSSDEVQQGESEKSTAASLLRNKQLYGGGHRD